MISTIVCGADASRGARCAATVAGGLARRTGARLLLVNAVPQAIPPFARTVTPTAPTAVLDRRGEAEKAAAEALTQLSLGAGADAEIAVIDGSPDWALPDRARMEGADLLVIGARRHSALGAAFFGSVTVAVLRRAPCPVVVVPRTVDADDDPLRDGSVVCGLEVAADDERDERVATLGASLAEELGMRLVLAHVVAPSHDVAVSIAGAIPVEPEDDTAAASRTVARLASVADRLVATSPRLDHVALRQGHGAVADGLLHIARQEEAAFIVADSRRHGPLRATLLGSVSTHLMQHGHLPIVVPGSDRDESAHPAASRPGVAHDDGKRA